MAHALTQTLAVVVALALTAGAATQGNAAPAFPDKPVRLVVASAPGGGTDIISRMLGHGLTDAWNQQVVVDNRSGAGGTIATDIVAKSQPDGYTLLFQGLGITYAPALYKTLPFDTNKDIAGVALVATQPFVMVVPASLPVKSVAEFIQLARSKPGEIRFGSGGIGGASHLGGELFRVEAKIDILHVPYKGTGPGVTAVLSGEIQMLLVGISTALPHAKANRIKMLGVTGAKRAAVAPDLPRIGEAGLPGYEFDVWYGLYAPGQTPRATVAKINADTNRFLKSAEATERFSRAGVEPLGGGVKEFAQYMRSEAKRWAEVIKAAGIKPR